MRDLGAAAVGDLPDRLARLCFNLRAVEDELDGVGHRRSSWKCFSTDFTGFIAAWPSPQIEASVMTLVNSPCSVASQAGRSMILTAFSVPTRHGVHWPQLSSSKNLRRLSATSRMLSLSESTTTAWLPTKQPYCSSVPKSSGMSAIDAGRIPPEAPPGR